MTNFEDRLNEQIILTIDQRREIEQLEKDKMTIENKLKYDMNAKNHTIHNLERRIESLQDTIHNLKKDKHFDSQQKGNLDHYIEKIELNEISLKGTLQEATKENEDLKNYNSELLKEINDLKDINIELKQRLNVDINVNEDRIQTILSSKIASQK
jgi:chromosome segregation ATPase